MKKIALLGLVLALASGLRAEDELSTSLDGLLTELDALRVVDGNAVGFSAAEGRFFRIYRRLLELDAEKLPEKLLESPLPIRRSMGLVLIAARDEENAARVLRESLEDRGPVTVNPVGCVHEYGSVGVVARGLLGDPDWTAGFGGLSPILTPEEFVAIDLELLGRDDTALLHEHLGDALLLAIEDGKLPLDLAALTKKHPGIPAVRLVKAIGRLRSDEYYSPAQKAVDRFILDLAGDREQPAPVRLAAASALAQWSRFESRESPRPLPGSVFKGLPKKEAVAIRRDFAAAHEFKREREKSAAFEAGHILLLPSVNAALSILEHQPEKRLPKRSVEALMNLSKRLAEWQAEWNTFGNGLYLFDAAVSRDGERLERELGAKQCALLTSRVQAAIAADK